MTGTPHVLLIDIPPHARNESLLLAPYYAALLESDAECAEFEAFLTASRDVPTAPDLLDQRPSAVTADGVALVHYDPPLSGWPWLSVCRCSPDLTATPASAAMDMARGCSTFEAFLDASERERHSTMLLSTLVARAPLTTRLLAADRITTTGTG